VEVVGGGEADHVAARVVDVGDLTEGGGEVDEDAGVAGIEGGTGVEGLATAVAGGREEQVEEGLGEPLGLAQPCDGVVDAQEGEDGVGEACDLVEGEGEEAVLNLGDQGLGLLEGAEEGGTRGPGFVAGAAGFGGGCGGWK